MLSVYYFWRGTRDYRGCAWEWRKGFWGSVNWRSVWFFWREACTEEVWTWKGVILLALSHCASGRCCTAHCIFQLQFQPSNHCKPLWDLISLEDPCSWGQNICTKDFWEDGKDLALKKSETPHAHSHHIEKCSSHNTVFTPWRIWSLYHDNVDPIKISLSSASSSKWIRVCALVSWFFPTLSVSRPDSSFTLLRSKNYGCPLLQIK